MDEPVKTTIEDSSRDPEGLKMDRLGQRVLVNAAIGAVTLLLAAVCRFVAQLF